MHHKLRLSIRERISYAIGDALAAVTGRAFVRVATLAMGVSLTLAVRA